MPAFTDWFPPAVVGALFTIMGSLKLYGLARGVVGGRGRPVFDRACGT